jgi:hypothetical protein
VEKLLKLVTPHDSVMNSKPSLEPIHNVKSPEMNVFNVELDHKPSHFEMPNSPSRKRKLPNQE